MNPTEIRFGERKLPDVPSEEHFENVRGQTLLDNKEFLEPYKKLAYEALLKSNPIVKCETAADMANFFFRSGWDAAITTLSEEKKEPNVVKDKKFDFNQATVSITFALGIHGNAEERENAKQYFSQLVKIIA